LKGLNHPVRVTWLIHGLVDINLCHLNDFLFKKMFLFYFTINGILNFTKIAMHLCLMYGLNVFIIYVIFWYYGVVLRL